MTNIFMDGLRIGDFVKVSEKISFCYGITISSWYEVVDIILSPITLIPIVVIDAECGNIRLHGDDITRVDPKGERISE